MSLTSTYVEGFEAVRQPCTLPLLLSALVFALAAGRGAPLAVIAHVGGAAILAWARFTQLWTVDVTGFTAILAGGTVAAAAVFVARRRRDRAAIVLGAGLGGAIAAAVWRPCVGSQLGAIINDAPDHRISALVPTIAYVAGLSTLALVIASVPSAFPSLGAATTSTPVVVTGAALGVALGLAMAVGIWDDVVLELLERSRA